VDECGLHFRLLDSRVPQRHRLLVLWARRRVHHLRVHCSRKRHVLDRLDFGTAPGVQSTLRFRGGERSNLVACFAGERDPRGDRALFHHQNFSWGGHLFFDVKSRHARVRSIQRARERSERLGSPLEWGLTRGRSTEGGKEERSVDGGWQGGEG